MSRWRWKAQDRQAQCWKAVSGSRVNGVCACVHACLCAFTHEERLYECVERICLSVHVSAVHPKASDSTAVCSGMMEHSLKSDHAPRPVHCPPKEMKMSVWVIGCLQTLKPTNKHTYTFTATIICCLGSPRLRKTPYKEYKCSFDTKQ